MLLLYQTGPELHRPVHVQVGMFIYGTQKCFSAQREGFPGAVTPAFLPVPKVKGKANPVNYSVGFINSANEGEACMVGGERARPSALGHRTQGAPKLLPPFQGGERCQG